MEFYSPERPEVSPGQKAILTDGSALPHMVCTPMANNETKLMCLLRAHDKAASAYTYGYHSVTLPDAELRLFFETYRNDPEYCLYHYFKWVPKAVAASAGVTNERAGAKTSRPVVLPKDVADMFADADDFL